MSVKKQHDLHFGKLKVKGFSDHYSCRCGTSTLLEGHRLAEILTALDIDETLGLVEEMDNAMTGEGYYEENFTFDAHSSDWVDIIPPNVIISDMYTMRLLDLKELLEEWIKFMQK